jgi:protoheme ferro-lyase
MINKTRLCCFTVNYTHACIIANNFIANELTNVKVIYINEKQEKKKLKNIISRLYKKVSDKNYSSEWLNENIIHDFEKENFVFVVSRT